MSRAARRAARAEARRAGGPGHRRRSGAPAVVVVLALALAGGWAARSFGWEGPGFLAPRAFVEVDGRAVAVPRPEPAQGRLLPPVAVATSGAHAFLHTAADGTPVGYDPCRPVRYVVRPSGAPAQGEAILADAMAILSDATGLAFVAAGTTDEAPSLERPLIQPDRYGEGWAPVLVAWSDESEVPELAGQVAGVGGSAAVPGATGEGRWLAAGRVALDVGDLSAMLARSDGYAQARAIVVHELAHVLGLDHVADPGELMHPTTSTRTDLGPGDLQGLALVGQVACEP